MAAIRFVNVDFTTVVSLDRGEVGRIAMQRRRGNEFCWEEAYRIHCGSSVTTSPGVMMLLEVFERLCGRWNSPSDPSDQSESAESDGRIGAIGANGLIVKVIFEQECKSRKDLV